MGGCGGAVTNEAGYAALPFYRLNENDPALTLRITRELPMPYLLIIS
jgi:hypothetical protein